jgi:hypothetical protein
MSKVVNKYTDKDIFKLEAKVNALTEFMNKMSGVTKDKCENKEEKYFNKNGKLIKHLTIGNYIQYHFGGANTGEEKSTGIIIGVDLDNNSPANDIYTVYTAHGYIISVYGRNMIDAYKSIVDVYPQVTKYGFNLITPIRGTTDE